MDFSNGSRTRLNSDPGYLKHTLEVRNHPLNTVFSQHYELLSNK